MDFSIGNLVGGVVGAVVAVATAVAGAVSAMKSAFSSVAEAVMGAAAAVANACEDFDEDAEELIEEEFKLLVGAFIAGFGSWKLGSEEDNDVFNIFDIQPKAKYEINGSMVDEYLFGNNDSLFNAKVAALKGSAKAEAKIGLFEHKNEYGRENEIDFSPKFNIGVEEEFKTVEISGEMKQVGNKNLGIAGEVSTTAYSEKAEAGIEIGEDKNTGKLNCKGKAGAIASLHSAKAEEKFTILGLEIGVEEEGHVGAIGASAEAGIDQGKIKVEVKAAALLGIGASVSVGLAD